MNRLPTITSAQHLIDAVDALHGKPRDRKLAERYGSTIDAIRQRLIGTPDNPGALRRELAHGTNTPDGYPRSTMSNGPHGTAELTPVEAAAHARHRPPHDQHRQLTLRATHALDQMVASLNTLMSALASIDDLRNDNLGPAPKVCAACRPVRDIIATVYATGTVGGRLDKPADLCKDCYEFVRRAGRMPTHTEVADHERRGRWRIRSTPAQ